MDDSFVSNLQEEYRLFFTQILSLYEKNKSLELLDAAKGELTKWRGKHPLALAIYCHFAMRPQMPGSLSRVCFEALLQLELENPANLVLKYAICLVLIANNEANEANVYFEELSAELKNSDSAELLFFFLGSGSAEEKLQFSLSLIQKECRFPRVFIAAAFLFLQLGKFDEALNVVALFDQHFTHLEHNTLLEMFNVSTILSASPISEENKTKIQDRAVAYSTELEELRYRSNQVYMFNKAILDWTAFSNTDDAYQAFRDLFDLSWDKNLALLAGLNLIALLQEKGLRYECHTACVKFIERFSTVVDPTPIMEVMDSLKPLPDPDSFLGPQTGSRTFEEDEFDRLLFFDIEAEFKARHENASAEKLDISADDIKPIRILISELPNIRPGSENNVPNDVDGVSMLGSVYGEPSMMLDDVALDEALQHNPKNPAYLYQKALSHLTNGQVNEFKELFHTIYSLDPQFKTEIITYGLGKLHFLMKRYEESLFYLVLCYRTGKNLGKTLLLMARIFERKGDLVKAEFTFNKLTKVCPNELQGLYTAGKFYFHKVQNFDKAKNIFNRIIASDAYHFKALAKLGILILDTTEENNRKEISVGLSHLSNALGVPEITPKFRLIVFERLSHYYESNGERDLAIKYAQWAVKIEPKVEIMAFLGSLYTLSGKHNRALEAYKVILKIEPKNIQVLTKIGALYAFSQEYEKCKRYLKYVITLDPTNDAANHLIGRIYRMVDRKPNLAIKAFSNMLEGPLADQAFFEVTSTDRAYQPGAKRT